MRNITFSADEHLVDQARQIARSRNTTLNDAFRAWLGEYAGQDNGVREYRALMKEIRSSGATAGGRTFSREERNVR